MFDRALRTLVRHRCRFVVVGSTARALLGEDVRPHDLDIVIDASPDQRARLTAALVELDAQVEHHCGQRAVACSVVVGCAARRAAASCRRSPGRPGETPRDRRAGDPHLISMAPRGTASHPSCTMAT